MKWYAVLAWAFIWLCAVLSWAYGEGQPMAWRAGKIICTEASTEPPCRKYAETAPAKEAPKPILRDVRETQAPADSLNLILQVSDMGRQLEVKLGGLFYLFRVVEGRITLISAGPAK